MTSDRNEPFSSPDDPSWPIYCELVDAAVERAVPREEDRGALRDALLSRSGINAVNDLFVGRLSDALFLFHRMGEEAQNPVMAYLSTKDARMLVRVVGGPTLLDTLQVERICEELGAPPVDSFHVVPTQSDPEVTSPSRPRPQSAPARLERDDAFSPAATELLPLGDADVWARSATDPTYDSPFYRNRSAA